MNLFFSKRKYTDKKIIKALLDGNSEQNKCLYFLYKKQFPITSRYITQNNGTTEEAKEVFHATMTIFYEQVKNKQFEAKEHEPTVANLIQMIAQTIWHSKLPATPTANSNNNHKKMNKSTFKKVQIAIEQYEQTNMLLGILDGLGEDCKKILTYYFYKGWSIPMITRAMGSKNPHNMRNKKSKCHQRLKDLIKNNSSIRPLLDVRQEI